MHGNGSLMIKVRLLEAQDAASLPGMLAFGA